MAVKKTDQVKRLIEHGDYKAALRMAKDFRINVTKAQRDTMTRGYECIVNPRFYKSIGTDTEKAIADGIAVLTQIV
ncbi:MAG: hypothetical protein IKP95_09560 [Ruminococcus sp.]|nr:hypothetical protein [Ruminococcus sp.]